MNIDNKEETKKVEEPKPTGTSIDLGSNSVEEKTVPIKQSTLDVMMAKIERLEKTANKGRLYNFDEANKGEITRNIPMRSIDGRVIISWVTIANDVYRDPRTKLIVEDQKIKVQYEDETSEEMDIVVFNRRWRPIHATMVSETKLVKKEDIKKSGNIIYKLSTSEGKEYTIGSAFVN